MDEPAPAASSSRPSDAAPPAPEGASEPVAGTVPVEERRAGARWPVDLEARWRAVGGDATTREGPARLRDVSAGGARLRTRPAPPAGTAVDVEVAVPDGEAVSLRGVVLGAGPARGGWRDTRVAFAGDASEHLPRLTGRSATVPSRAAARARMRVLRNRTDFAAYQADDETGEAAPPVIRTVSDIYGPLPPD